MEDYEVNVLKRNGGWKKLSQTDNVSRASKKKFSDNTETKLSINIKDSSETVSKNIYNDLKKVNEIIKKLETLQFQKNQLFEELSLLEKNISVEKSQTSQKLNEIKEKYELYDKTINIIKSLKEI